LPQAIRRIEALTGDGALSYLLGIKEKIDRAAQLLKLPEDKVVDRVEELLEESKHLKKRTRQITGTIGFDRNRRNVQDQSRRCKGRESLDYDF